MGGDFQRMYLEQLRIGLPKALAREWILIPEEVVRCDLKVFCAVHVEDQLLHSIPSPPCIPHLCSVKWQQTLQFCHMYLKASGNRS